MRLVFLGTPAFAVPTLGRVHEAGHVVAAVLTQPDRPRSFTTPLVPFVPIMGILIAVGQMVSLPWQTWTRLIVWMALGFVLYFCYGIKHSVLRQHDNPEIAKWTHSKNAA